MSRVMLVLPSCNSLRSYSAALSAAVFAVAVVLLSVSAASSAAGTDLEWPSIGLGTAGLQQRTEDVVMLALSQGVRLVDTAQAAEWYDERAIGEALKYFPAADEV